MAMTGSFGMPERVHQSAAPRQYPQLLVLSVTVSESGFERAEDIGAAVNESELGSYFDEWISHPENRSRYAGRKRVKKVPFVGRL